MQQWQILQQNKSSNPTNLKKKHENQPWLTIATSSSTLLSRATTNLIGSAVSRHYKLIKKTLYMYARQQWICIANVGCYLWAAPVFCAIFMLYKAKYASKHRFLLSNSCHSHSFCTTCNWSMAYIKAYVYINMTFPMPRNYHIQTSRGNARVNNLVCIECWPSLF